MCIAHIVYYYWNWSFFSSTAYYEKKQTNFSTSLDAISNRNDRFACSRVRLTARMKMKFACNWNFLHSRKSAHQIVSMHVVHSANLDKMLFFRSLFVHKIRFKFQMVELCVTEAYDVFNNIVFWWNVNQYLYWIECALNWSKLLLCENGIHLKKKLECGRKNKRTREKIRTPF